MDNVTAPFVVRRMAGAIGAEIGGVKLRPDLPDAVIAELRRLWLEHLVLFFRNQELTPQELAAVARRFGEVVHYPFLKGLDEAPDVIRWRSSSMRLSTSAGSGTPIPPISPSRRWRPC